MSCLKENHPRKQDTFILKFHSQRHVQRTQCLWTGLDEVMAGELVEFEEGTIGIALNLESNNVGLVLMGDALMIQYKKEVL